MYIKVFKKPLRLNKNKDEPATLIKTNKKYNNKNLSAPDITNLSLGFTRTFTDVKTITIIAK